MTAPLIEVDGLVKHFVARRSLFGTPLATVNAVDGVSFSLAAGEMLGLVGAPGCGKSVTVLAVMGLLPKGDCDVSGAIRRAARHDLAAGSVPVRAARSAAPRGRRRW